MSAWLEVALSVDGEAAEAVAELLQRFGHQGVAIEQEGIMPELWTDEEVQPPQRLTVRAYFPADARMEDTKARLETALGHMNMLYPMPTPVYTIVNETDWAEAWKVHYHPIRIGQRLLIRPRWIEVETGPDDVVIALDPGMAFGTGTHPSTQLCLEALEDRVTPGVRALDLGSGSGILAIAAVKLGAAHVLAVDNDPIAVRVTVENAEQNGVASAITSEEGSLAELRATGQQFELAAINILARIIIAMCADGLGEIIAPGGCAIFGGIILEQADDVEAALRSAGLEPYQRRLHGDWVVIEARRPA